MSVRTGLIAYNLSFIAPRSLNSLYSNVKHSTLVASSVISCLGGVLALTQRNEDVVTCMKAEVRASISFTWLGNLFALGVL